MQALKTVLSDKKIWVALVGLVAGIAVALGFDESTVATISGGAISLISVVLMAVMGVKTVKTTTTQDQPQLFQSQPDTQDDTEDQP